jgi:hypothetical protein
MDNVDETIVYLCLTLGWTFPESVRFVKETPLKKVRLFVKELQYQKAVEDYRMSQNFAMALTTWANAQKKGNHFTAKDFIGSHPQRDDSQEQLSKAIKKAGIKLPEEK